MEWLKNMSSYILGNTKRIFNPCRICKHRDTIGAIACGCTKKFLSSCSWKYQNKFKKKIKSWMLLAVTHKMKNSLNTKQCG